MACGGSEQVPETEEEKALAEIAAERWNDYKQRFIPIENRAIDDIMQDVNTPDMFGAGMANLATQQQFAGVEQGTVAGLFKRRAGGNALGAGIINANRDRIASSASGQANAMGLNTTRNIHNLQSMVNVGLGQAGSALSGMGDAASAAQRQAILDARASAASRAAVGQVAGTAAGLGYGYYNGPSSGNSTPYGTSWTDSALAGGGFTDVPTQQAAWAAGTGN